MDKENPDSVTIGARIRELRREAELTQQAFAKDVGVSLPTVHRVETGQRFPDAMMLIAIRQKFDADLNWLLTGLGDMKRGVIKPDGAQEVLIPLIRKLSKRLMDSPAKDVEGLLSLPGFPPGAVACRSADDGCAPRVSAGDVVIFAPVLCDVGDWVVVCDEWGRGVVRQKREQDGKCVYVADHPGYARLTDGDVTCLGKVCGTIRKFA
jgi:transcriptional regulator with XRE-family HTH domain